jgi:hypothetical protein
MVGSGSGWQQKQQQLKKDEREKRQTDSLKLHDAGEKILQDKQRRVLQKHFA